ncbi:MAG: CrcB family protein [Planctomycetales bacterium]|nr:CrcB family protein [Planctomycetales bacterium]
MAHIMAVALGGSAGALCRYGVALACIHWFGAHAAFGTLAVNVAGCLIIGVFGGASLSPGALAHSGLVVGFLGALTTFSSFGLDTARLATGAGVAAAILNVAANLFFGLAAVAVGLWLGRGYLS